MSWHAGSQFFRQAINVIEDHINSEYEQIIYLSGLLNMLVKRDLEIESIEQPVLDDMFDRRCSLHSKYLNQIEVIFKSVRSHGVLPHVMASTKESVERSELKSMDRHSSKAIDAFLEIVKLSAEYEVDDDEFFIGDLVSAFLLTEEDIDHIRKWHPKTVTDYTAYEYEKISYDEKLAKKYSRLKNYSEIQKKVKTVETNWKRALAKERKKVLGTSSKVTKRKSESKTGVESKIVNDQSELISKYPYSEDDFQKYDREIVSNANEFRDSLVKQIQLETKVSRVDIELILDYVEDSLLKNILSRKGWDLFDLLHIEVLHEKGGAKHKIENPHSGKQMTFKSNKYTVTGTLSPRLKRILDGEEIHYQGLLALL